MSRDMDRHNYTARKWIAERTMNQPASTQDPIQRFLACFHPNHSQAFITCPECRVAVGLGHLLGCNHAKPTR